MPSLEHRRRHSESGFSLLEVLVALVVLAIAILTLSSLRTESIGTSAEARNLRVARHIAVQVLSEVEAGTRRCYDERGREQTLEHLPMFRYKIVIGEAEIQEEESNLLEQEAETTDSEASERKVERLEWLNRRSDILRARKQGIDYDDLETQELEEDDSPDADTVEEIAVYVFWPKARLTEEGDNIAYYRLRGRATTLALSGLTEEQAEEKGDGASDSPGSSSAASGNASGEGR